MDGPSSSTPFGGGQMGLGAGGEGGVSFTFLLGREKTGGESCRDNIKMMEVRKQEAGPLSLKDGLKKYWTNMTS